MTKLVKLVLCVTDLLHVLVSCYIGLHVGDQTLAVCKNKHHFQLQY